MDRLVRLSDIIDGLTGQDVSIDDILVNKGAVHIVDTNNDDEDDDE